MPIKWLNRLRYLLALWAGLFFIATCVFYFRSNELLQFFNDVSLYFQLPLEMVSLSSERFWLVLTISLMTTLIYLCLSTAINIKKRLHQVGAILVSKSVSAVFFTIGFFFVSKSLAFLMGAVVDGGIYFITSFFYSKAIRELSYRDMV